MILSDSAAEYVRQTGRPLFDLDDRVPVVAYVDATGRVLCPAHRDHARGDVDPQEADNSAAEDDRCDSPGCGYPIAAVMLAARAAQAAPDCYPCRSAYLNLNGAPARPCPAHTSYPVEILAAIVDGTPLPTPPWETRLHVAYAGRTSRGKRHLVRPGSVETLCGRHVSETIGIGESGAEADRCTWCAPAIDDRWYGVPVSAPETAPAPVSAAVDADQAPADTASAPAPFRSAWQL